MSDIAERLRELADLFELGDAPRHIVLHMRAGADEVQRLRINEASFRRHTIKTERWRGALVNIAQGKGDPVAIACAALELDNE